MIDNIIEIEDYFILVKNDNKVPFLSGTLHLGFLKSDYNNKVII